MLTQKSYMAKPSVNKKWYLFDAEGKVLGRMAVQIATILMGKHKPQYTPHIDTGDFVVVVNAPKIKITGRKVEQKNYYRWSGYPSGLRVRNLGEMMEKRPEEVIRLAVRRMLPKNKLGRHLLKKLKIYTTADHPHTAQQPEVWQDPRAPKY
ncbi:MAG: 50S ribosomal protein L13 [Planctomycetes bacterium]|jgi:large subunit ribosomal protein L13|nr:50S ribosomal protein L13 [Planctomycetota bacterium]HNZ66432.1 50S ribosomal protein L13 [Planctomycetota bacterium]HPY74543.1 50S ribosomal protein L13 [Planctomycetota bacterium]HQB00187.1 50S ribosomal protein L13 [Planctomycetota bacterium]HRU51076.1 50S ribosomal protein L13 [Planctomycetota bacterium]